MLSTTRPDSDLGTNTLTVGPLAIGALRQSHSRAGVPSSNLSALQIYCLISLYVKKNKKNKKSQAKAVTNHCIWFVVSWVAWPLGGQVSSRCFQRWVSLTMVLSFFLLNIPAFWNSAQAPKPSWWCEQQHADIFFLLAYPLGNSLGLYGAWIAKDAILIFLLFDSSSWQTLVAGK